MASDILLLALNNEQREGGMTGVISDGHNIGIVEDIGQI